MTSSAQETGRIRNPTIGVAVLPGMPLFEIAVPCEVFGTPRPGLVEPPYEVQLCAAEAISSFGAFSLQVAHDFAALASADTVIIPALPTWDTPIPDSLLVALKAAHERGARVVGLCTGAFALATAGLLDGLPATTHWMYAAQLASRFPRVLVDRDVLYAGTAQVMTSAGTASGLDLCLELVRRDHGAAVANGCCTPDGRRSAPGGRQAQFITAAPAAMDDRSLAPALDWALEHLSESITAVEMAAAMHVSVRTLSRHFRDQLGTTPARWLIEQKVRRAQELLETTRFTIAQIAPMAGFASALRSHFSSVAGTSPRVYRRSFNPSALTT